MGSSPTVTRRRAAALTRFAAAAALLVFGAGCGGASSSSGGGSGGAGPAGSGGQPASSAAPNTVPVTVDTGPPGVDYVNGLFVTLTLCVPGTTNCQTFDHVLVDTGSIGVRVLASAVTLPLPALTNASNQQLVECIPFVEGTAWGPLGIADVKMGGESAANLPIQLIGDQTYAVPSSCTGSPVTDLQSLSANGILGVGIFPQDCGDACAQPAASRTNPGLYYACTSPQSCAVTSVPVAQQVGHPVAAFPIDNNGSIIKLPSIGGSGAPVVAGTLTFGIGTQSNNGLGSAAVLPLDAMGFVSTTFPVGGTTYTSYLDSGSNGLYFLNSRLASLPLCAGTLDVFYCPTATTTLSAVLSVSNGPSATIPFIVGNANAFKAVNSAFSDLGGPMPGFPTDPRIPGFDWGLPFFFGRSVYTAIDGRGTPVGPYFAF